MTVTRGLWTRSTVARWAGGLYLAYILASVLASRLGHIGLSDAPTLRATISGDETMFRLGLVAALASALLFVLTAWALYALLRPVNGPLALLLLVLNAVGVAVQCASYLPLLAVLAQGDSAVDVQAFTGPQLRRAGPAVGHHIPDRVRHGPVVLLRVAVPPRLARAALRVPAPFPRMATPARRCRSARVVPAGAARPGVPRDQLSSVGGRLHRRARPRAVAAREGRDGGGVGPRRPVAAGRE